MQDRPDLIQSELAGLAFDSLQQVFRKADLVLMFDTTHMPLPLDQTIWIVIDPAAGGPQSDYAVVSICRIKGCVVVLARARSSVPCSLAKYLSLSLACSLSLVLLALCSVWKRRVHASEKSCGISLVHEPGIPHYSPAYLYS